MNVPAILALTTVVGSLVMSACAWALSTSPGWRGLRWFSGVTLVGALFGACELTVASAASDPWVLWAGRLTLTSAALVIWCWIPFGAVLEGRVGLLPVERWLRRFALGLALLAVIPGVMSQGEIFEHRPGGDVVYREAVLTPLGSVPILFFLVALSWCALRLARTARKRGSRELFGPMMSLWILGAAAVHDSLVLARFHQAPYLLVSAFLVVMMVIGAGILSRVVGDANALARVSRELAEAQATLVQRERLAAIGGMAAVMAHEVRNPLAVLYNVVSQLRHHLPDLHPGRPLVEMASEESERIERIVGELLDFTRPQPAQLRPCDVAEVLQSAVHAALSSTRLGVQHVELSVTQAPPWVLADASLLYRAIVNLVTNALQSSGREGPVRVSVLPTASTGVQVDVIDDGDGIPAEDAERIFEPFFTTRATGTGLGLSIARQAATAHGGTLELITSEVRGAHFRFSLPMRLAVAAPAFLGA